MAKEFIASEMMVSIENYDQKYSLCYCKKHKNNRFALDFLKVFLIFN